MCVQCAIKENCWIELNREPPTTFLCVRIKPQNTNNNNNNWERETHTSSIRLLTLRVGRSVGVCSQWRNGAEGGTNRIHVHFRPCRATNWGEREKGLRERGVHANEPAPLYLPAGGSTYLYSPFWFLEKTKKRRVCFCYSRREENSLQPLKQPSTWNMERNIHCAQLSSQWWILPSIWLFIFLKCIFAFKLLLVSDECAYWCSPSWVWKYLQVHFTI